MDWQNISSMKKFKIISLLFVIGMLLNACAYDFIAKEELPPIDQTVTISFATQIVPIWANSCVSCHKAGGQAPDLSAANAYTAIKGMANVVVTATPETSRIYTYPSPSTSVHSWKKYTAAEAQLVLTWIQQGAKNN